MTTNNSRTIDIPAEWRGALKQIMVHRWRKLLVIGASDRGKSTFCNFLSTALLCNDARVSFVDGDIGQKDVGPPATITLANAKVGKSISALPVQSLYFVGAVNPSAHFITMVIGTQRMVEQARGDVVIIDTSGHVTGKGKALKALLIEALRPDLIVMLEKGGELSAIYSAHRHLNLIRLPASSLAQGKSPNRRRAARQQAFRTYFAGATEQTFTLQELVIQRTRLFTGTAINDPLNLHTEQSDEGILAVSKTRTIVTMRRLKVVPCNFAEQLLCSVSDERGECLGLAVIRHYDFAADVLTLYTPVAKSSIRSLQMGDLYLDDEWKELEHQRRGHF